MYLSILYARFAQVLGLVMGLAFGAMWLGARTELPLVSGVSRAYIRSNGTLDQLLFGATTGVAIFVVGTAVFAIPGIKAAAKNIADLRRSGWR